MVKSKVLWKVATRKSRTTKGTPKCHRVPYRLMFSTFGNPSWNYGFHTCYVTSCRLNFGASDLRTGPDRDKCSLSASAVRPVQQMTWATLVRTWSHMAKPWPWIPLIQLTQLSIMGVPAATPILKLPWNVRFYHLQTLTFATWTLYCIHFYIPIYTVRW